MSTRTPIVCQINWLALIPFLMVLGLLVFLGYLILPRKGPILGILVFYALLRGISFAIPRHHRAAIRFAKQGCFKEAISEYRKSLAFFERYPWIDRFRSIVILSLSAISYREMDLLGMAFCYGQVGDGNRARETYEKCLGEFPDSGMAISALCLLDSVRESKG